MRKLSKQWAILLLMGGGILVLGGQSDYADSALELEGLVTDDLALIAVEDSGPGITATILAADIMVVRAMLDYTLVVADRDQLAWLRQQDFDAEILDADLTDKTYYTVGFRTEAQKQNMVAEAQVLRLSDAEGVVAASADIAEAISADGCEVARVFLRPVRLPSPIKPSYRVVRQTADPEVEAIVAEVSGAAINTSVQRLQDFQTRYATHDSCQAAAEYIAAKFTEAEIDSVYFQNFSSTYKDNVVAVIPGVHQPEKTVVVGGHYDSITSNHNFCPGADDDASGTSAVLECARVLSGHQFEYTLKFVAFCAEEQGLYGSEAFASDAAANGEDIVAAVCVDMIGYLAGGDLLDIDIVDNASSQWIRDLVVEVGSTYVPELPVVDGSLPFGASSDHASFWAAGYDAILFFEDTGSYSPYIHSANDVVGLSYNSPVLAERSVKLAAGLLATLARPFNVAISHTPLTHTENSVDPYRVVADIVTSGTLNPDSLLVYYDTGAGAANITLIETGNPDEYEAFIPAQPAGTFVDYYLLAEDSEGHRATHPENAPPSQHSFFVGEQIAAATHDMESEQDWIVGAPGDNATTGIWERVDPVGSWEASILVQPEDDHTPDPGVLCFVTGNAPPGAGQGENDVDGGRTTLLSPVFDLSFYDHAWVRYWRWYTNDTGFSPGEDNWVVEISADGGTVWETVEYTSTSQREWLLVDQYLNDLTDLSDQVQFRFIASDEGSGSVVEAAVDDFSIYVFNALPVPVEEMPGADGARVVLGPNVPNPFNPATTIQFRVPEPGRTIDLRIYGVTGRLVRTLLRNEMVSGSHEVIWRGRNDRGEEVASGIYFYRLDAGDQSLTRKLMLVR